MDKYYTAEAKRQRRAYIQIALQKGPVSESGPNGCHVEDVIDWCIAKLREWNSGPLKCRENSLAITDLENAGNWMVRRRMNRIEQGVEGTMEPHDSFGQSG